jgi:hypothetical protein
VVKESADVNSSRIYGEVRDAAGHANVNITSEYLHVAVEEEARVRHLFG